MCCMSSHCFFVDQGSSGGGGQGQSQASRLGHMVMDSAAHGFGFTLGELLQSQLS